jgi:Poly A polymerase head domain
MKSFMDFPGVSDGGRAPLGCTRYASVVRTETVKEGAALGKRLALPPALLAVAADVRKAGGRLLVVGGAVRDGLRGSPPRDIDCEVHGLAAPELRRILSARGRCVAVGKAFGVFKVDLEGASFDVGLPRPEGEAGQGSMLSAADPHVGLTVAARRRDMTINAIAFDPLSSTIEDPLRGADDLGAGTLRACDLDHFLDDPLRVWRVARFAACLEMEIDPALDDLCLHADVSQVPAERVLGELHRLLVVARVPSRGLSPARRWGLLRLLLPQVPDAAGPAVDHAADRAAAQAQPGDADHRRLTLGWCALLHPISPLDAVNVLYGLRIGQVGGYPLRKVVGEVLTHFRALQGPLELAALREMADMVELDLACRAAWCLAVDDSAAAAAMENLKAAASDGVDHHPHPPLLDARRLTAHGVPPGPALGALLAQVRQAQHRGAVTDPDDALQTALSLWQATALPRSDD